MSMDQSPPSLGTASPAYKCTHPSPADGRDSFPLRKTGMSTPPAVGRHSTRMEIILAGWEGLCVKIKIHHNRLWHEGYSTDLL